MKRKSAGKLTLVLIVIRGINCSGNEWEPGGLLVFPEGTLKSEEASVPTSCLPRRWRMNPTRGRDWSAFLKSSDLAWDFCKKTLCAAPPLQWEPLKKRGNGNAKGMSHEYIVFKGSRGSEADSVGGFGRSRRLTRGRDLPQLLGRREAWRTAGKMERLTKLPNQFLRDKFIPWDVPRGGVGVCVNGKERKILSMIQCKHAAASNWLIWDILSVARRTTTRPDNDT